MGSLVPSGIILGNNIDATKNFHLDVSSGGVLTVRKARADGQPIGSRLVQINEDGGMNTFGSLVMVEPNAAQSLTGDVANFINFQTKVHDINNEYDTATGRFTPKQKGWYRVTARVALTAAMRNIPILYKNGTVSTGQEILRGTDANNAFSGTMDGLVYMNGTTDYVIFYFYANSAATTAYGATLKQSFLNITFERAE